MFRSTMIALCVFAFTAHAQDNPGRPGRPGRPVPPDRVKLPDLTIKDIDDGRDSVKVRVSNDGRGDAGPCVLRVTVTAPGKPPRIFTAQVPALRAGADRRIKIETPGVRSNRDGTRIVAVVDFGNRVRESNQGNNTRVKVAD